MVTIMSLWLPILLSAIAVFIASSVIHMVLPYHKSDYTKLPSEDGVLDALRKFDLPAGDYMFPRPDNMQDMKTPAFQEKYAKGPTGLMTIYEKGPWAMGSTMTIWFVYSVVIGIAAAYVAGHALPPGAPWKAVVRFTGATTFCCYGVALWQDSIWYKRSWATTLRSNFDSVIYAALSAALFACLWPK
jgi:hypothetical protein